MSEYQYYEFRAIDRPLTAQQMSELRGLSTRAEITSSSFTNTYNYGSFRGDSHRLMESYFDAHVYVSNFGIFSLMIRVPSSILPNSALAPYASIDGLNYWNTGNDTIVEWRLEGEPSYGIVAGEGWMGQMLAIRDEFVRADYRSLYLGWLSGDLYDCSVDEKNYEAGQYPEDAGVDADTDSLEPPVPPGLGSLTAAQAALVKFLNIDQDLVTAAAELSPDVQSTAPTESEAANWVAELTEQEVRSIAARVLLGEGARNQMELQSRYYNCFRNSTTDGQRETRVQRRRGSYLVARAEQITHERIEKHTEEQNRKRAAQLAELAKDLPRLWTKVNALMQEQKAFAYTMACSLLVDMRDAYIHEDRLPEFDADLARIIETNMRRTALLRRLKEHSLVP